MQDKKHYYVAIDTKEIREMPVDDNQIEFEVVASVEEIEEVNRLFHKMIDKARDSNEIMHFKPFKEVDVDEKVDTYDDSLKNIYRKIHELGTPETKSRIDEIGII